MGHRIETMQEFIRTQEKETEELKEHVQQRDETIRHLEQNLEDMNKMTSESTNGGA